MQKTQFHNIPSPSLVPSDLNLWMESLCVHYKVVIDQFAVNFIGKEKMLEMNQKYLNHDTHTDILTFDYGNQSWAACSLKFWNLLAICNLKWSITG